MERLHRLHPRRRVSCETVADPRNLVVTCIEIAPGIPRIVEPEGIHFLDRIGLESQEGRHRIGKLLPDNRFKSGAKENVVGGFLQHLKLPDMRIHIGNGDDPIEIVIPVDIRLLRKPEITLPPIEKAAPEEIADRNPIRFFVAESPVHPVELRETARITIHVIPLCVS